MNSICQSKNVVPNTICFFVLSGQVNHFRNERHMQLYGEDIPDPVATFEQLAEEYAISPKIMENLRTMGFTTPTEIETQAIPIMLQVSVSSHGHWYIMAWV